jgi:hypothetical protein
MKVQKLLFQDFNTLHEFFLDEKNHLFGGALQLVLDTKLSKLSKFSNGFQIKVYSLGQCLLFDINGGII